MSMWVVKAPDVAPVMAPASVRALAEKSCDVEPTKQGTSVYLPLYAVHRNREGYLLPAMQGRRLLWPLIGSLASTRAVVKYRLVFSPTSDACRSVWSPP